MKILSGKSIFTISAVLVGTVWVGIVSAVAAQFFPFLDFVGGLSGGVLSVVISLIYVWTCSSTAGRAEEVDGTSFWCASIFLGLTLVMNAVLVCLNLGDINSLLVCLNLAVYAIFAVVALLFNRYTTIANATIIRAAQKTYVSSELSQMIGTMLGMTEDSVVRDRLLNLKEMIDYSPNITIPAAQELEGQLFGCLQEIRTALADPRISQADIVNWIGRAEQICRQRNAVVSR